MKIKIINKNEKELEDMKFENEINEFIKDKKIIDIKYNIQTVYQNFFKAFNESEFDIESYELKSVLIMYDE